MSPACPKFATTLKKPDLFFAAGLALRVAAAAEIVAAALLHALM